MKNLAQRLIFSADCSQSMGLPSVLKIRRFENLFLFFVLFKDQASRLSKIQNCPKTGVYANLPKTGTSEVLFVPEYNTWGGGGNKGSTPPKKRDAWKKLRKERKKFSKLLIFSTDCSQSMGLQSVIKIRAKLQNFLRYTHRHIKDPPRTGSF